MNRTVIFLVLIIIVSSCNKNDKPDISDIRVNIDVHRFEIQLFEGDIYALDDSIASYKEQYPRFFPLYNNRILNIGTSNQPMYNELLRSFITDYSIYQTYKRTIEVYPEINFLVNKLDSAFRYYKHYFPEKDVPRFITYISGFNQSVVTDENLIGISLEKYLGQDDEIYDMLYPPLPRYVRYKMHKYKLPSDVMRAWGIAEFEFNDESANLIKHMIYEGRNMYFVKKMLPGEADTLIWGFTPEKLEFCNAHEKEMWTYLIENKLLFNNDKFRISQFIEDGPFTHDFSKDSPDRAAVWIGYRIVEQYMQQNENVSLKELMELDDYQKILNEAKYNP